MSQRGLLTWHAELEFLWMRASDLGHKLMDLAHRIGLLKRSCLLGELSSQPEASAQGVGWSWTAMAAEHAYQ